ncbi:MAG: IS4 family transposase [Chthoniobacterales bacterium]|nr:IS4 family transposase [Chthoniobacterales bacterium]
MTVFEKLIEPLQDILDEIEGTRHKHHNEVLSWRQFIIVLIYHFTVGSDSRNTLVVKLAQADPRLKLPKLASATISDAFRRFDKRLAQTAFKRLLSRLEVPEIPEIELLGTVILVDGSYFRFRHLAFWQNKRVQGVKLHMQLHLNRMVVADFAVDSKNSSERKHFVGMLHAGAIFVADRGFMSYDLLRQALACEAFVVIRATKSLVTTTTQSLAVEVPRELQHLWQNVRDSRVISAHKDAKGLEFRLVEFSIGLTTYKLITNHFGLTTYEVILLYAYRWQVEIVFRFLKRTMNGLQLITECQHGIQTFFSVLFITALLHLQFKFDCLTDEGLLASPVPSTPPPAPPIILAATSAQGAQPTACSGIKKGKVSFLGYLNNFTKLWRIPKHWLTTLADNLHRTFDHAVVSALNKQVLLPKLINSLTHP